MSARRTAFALAIGLLGAGGCTLIALKYAPLPASELFFYMSVAALAALSLIFLVLGLAIMLLLFLHALVPRFANRFVKPS